MFRITCFFTLLALISVSSCKNEPTVPVLQSDLSKIDTGYVQSVSTEGSVTFGVTGGTVLWSGKKEIGDAHIGTINIESGELLVSNGVLLSGHIVMDMNSLTVTSIKDGGEKRDLESHLKDVDFFEVPKYPKAEFSFNEVLPSNTPDFNQVIAGQLTIKNKTNGVNVPVKLIVSGQELTAQSPSFTINRTKWGINFRSGLLGAAKDKLIEDTVLLTIKLTAKQR